MRTITSADAAAADQRKGILLKWLGDRNAHHLWDAETKLNIDARQHVAAYSIDGVLVLVLQMQKRCKVQSGILRPIVWVHTGWELMLPCSASTEYAVLFPEAEERIKFLAAPDQGRVDLLHACDELYALADELAVKAGHTNGEERRNWGQFSRARRAMAISRGGEPDSPPEKQTPE